MESKIKLTPEDNFLNQQNEHTHLPSQTKIEVKKVKARVKERAENTNDTSQQILGAELQNINESTTVNLPALNNMRRNIRRQRSEQHAPIPQRREEIPALPHQYQITNRGDQFLLFDSGVGDIDRMLIFATMMQFTYLQPTIIGSWTVHSNCAQKYFSNCTQFTF